MRSLKICKLAAHACIRVQKMAIPLLGRGHKVYLLAEKTPSFVDSYSGYARCFSLEQMRNMVILMDRIVDIFHCHNEPSWFVSLVKEYSDRPVVLDVHDSFLTRSTPEEEAKAAKNGKHHLRISTEERNNFQLADALVFPSQPFAEAIVSEFKLYQPYIVLPSYLPRNFFGYMLKEYLGGLVYEGRIDLKDEIKQKGATGFQYTDLEELAKECKDIGMALHFYGRDDEKFKKVYSDLVDIHGAVPFLYLMQKLGRHDWGLVGNSFYTPEWEVALPNKLFEYVAAGVPVVSINAKNSSDFIAEHKIGITVESIKELASRWREHTDIRKNLLKVRSEFAMERHIHKLEQLYETIL